MKKLLATMLCAVMMISLVACSGSPSEEEVRGEQTSNEESQDESEVESTEEFSLGETENLVYENKFIGIGCKLESDWYFYNDEEIMEFKAMMSRRKKRVILFMILRRMTVLFRLWRQQFLICPE